MKGRASQLSQKLGQINLGNFCLVNQAPISKLRSIWGSFARAIGSLSTGVSHRCGGSVRWNKLATPVLSRNCKTNGNRTVFMKIEETYLNRYGLLTGFCWKTKPKYYNKSIYQSVLWVYPALFICFQNRYNSIFSILPRRICWKYRRSILTEQLRAAFGSANFFFQGHIQDIFIWSLSVPVLQYHLASWRPREKKDRSKARSSIGLQY
jgi:hypothetical protein